MLRELALQVGEVVLQADDDVLKIGRIVVTFLKIMRIFQNQDMFGYSLRSEYVPRNKKAPHPNIEKSAIKLGNRQEYALILEKELFKKIHLNTAYTRIAFYVSIWLKWVRPLDITGYHTEFCVMVNYRKVWN